MEEHSFENSKGTTNSSSSSSNSRSSSRRSRSRSPRHNRSDEQDYNYSSRNRHHGGYGGGGGGGRSNWGHRDRGDDSGSYHSHSSSHQHHHHRHRQNYGGGGNGDRREDRVKREREWSKISYNYDDDPRSRRSGNWKDKDKPSSSWKLRDGEAETPVEENESPEGPTTSSTNMSSGTPMMPGKINPSSSGIPSLLQLPIPGQPATAPMTGAKLVEEIEKRKSIFSKKEKPTPLPDSSSVYVKTTFSDDTSGQVSAKFKRLMGIKEPADPSKEQDDKESKKHPPPQGQGSSSTTGTGPQQNEYFEKLERQYEVARAITHTQRGFGLGFGSAFTQQQHQPK